jgi:hypothetical protein
MNSYQEFRLGDKSVLAMKDAIEDIVHFGLNVDVSFCGVSNFADDSSMEATNDCETCEDCLPEMALHLGIDEEALNKAFS